MFLAILYSIDGHYVSNRQNNASYVCVCVYLPVKVDMNVPETVDILWGGK